MKNLVKHEVENCENKHCKELYFFNSNYETLSLLKNEMNATKLSKILLHVINTTQQATDVNLRSDIGCILFTTSYNQ